ncbi:hypothetical protein ASE60_07825 [Ensifer sp. Root278]|nr:hypothetical protein ASE60_07825 [Ensifer sp. Root278]
MGLGGGDIEPVRNDATLDLAEEQSTEPPALDCRLDPQVGYRVVEVLSRHPTANAAFGFDQQNRQPVIGKKTEKRGFCHTPHYLTIGKTGNGGLPSGETDRRQPVDIAGAGMTDGGHDAGSFRDKSD